MKIIEGIFKVSAALAALAGVVGFNNAAFIHSPALFTMALSVAISCASITVLSLIALMLWEG